YIGGGAYCRDIARSLDPRQPFYTLSPYAIGGAGAPASIEELATAYLRTLRAAQPTGPYFLGGHSHAGLRAFAWARRLEADGQKVSLVAVLDVPVRDPSLRGRFHDASRELMERFWHDYLHGWVTLRGAPGGAGRARAPRPALVHDAEAAQPCRPADRHD